MKISFTTFACPEWPLPRILETAEELGYHGIEFRCDGNQRHGVEVFTGREERAEIRTLLERRGLQVPCLATSLQFLNETVADEALARIELASDLGAAGLRVFCGPMPAGLEMRHVVERAGEHLRLIAETAKQFNVELWLETHDTASRGADAAAILDQADHSALGVVYDNLHPFRRGESVEATFAAIGPRVRHVHLHDGLNDPDRVVIRPIGQGQLPMEEIMARLARMGYEGFVSGEWFNDQYGEDPFEALTAYRREVRDLAEQHGVELR